MALFPRAGEANGLLRNLSEVSSPQMISMNRVI